MLEINSYFCNILAGFCSGVGEFDFNLIMSGILCYTGCIMNKAQRDYLKGKRPVEPEVLEMVAKVKSGEITSEQFTEWSARNSELEYQAGLLAAAEERQRVADLKAEKLKFRVNQECAQAQIDFEAAVVKELAEKKARALKQDSLTRFSFVVPKDTLSQFKQAVAEGGSVSCSEVIRLFMAGFISN